MTRDAFRRRTSRDRSACSIGVSEGTLFAQVAVPRRATPDHQAGLAASQAEAPRPTASLYEQNLPTMRFLHSIDVPLPRVPQAAAASSSTQTCGGDREGR